MWDLLTTGVAALGGGGVFGLAANLFRGWLDERADNRRRQHEIALREEDRKDLQRELAGAAQRHSSEMEQLQARLGGESAARSFDGLIASMRGANDSIYREGMTNGQKWVAVAVDAIVKCQRPTVIFVLTASSVAGGASPVVLSLTGTAVGWLFGERFTLKTRSPR